MKVLATSTPDKPAGQADTRHLHTFPLTLGLGLGVVSGANLALIWWAPQFGTVQWELTAVSQTLDRLPLLLLSLFLVAMGVVLSGSTAATRIMAAVFLLTGVVVVGLGLLYGLGAVESWDRVRPDIIKTFKLSVAKTAVVATVYVALNWAFAFMLWRRTRVRPSSARLPAAPRVVAPQEAPHGSLSTAVNG